MHEIVITSNIKKNFLNNVLDIFKNGRLIKIKNKKEVFNVSKTDIDYLLKKKFKNFDKDISLEKIILADLNYLYSLVGFIDKNRSFTKLSKIKKDYFFTLYQRLKKSNFIQELNIKVCPYCNRNYIFNFNKKGSKNATAQLDHFFNKSSYPYLAISLYNLIPSCSTCNQRKSSKKISIHPYQKSLDDLFEFELNIKDISFLYKEGGFDIDLNVKDKLANKNVEIFNLKELYNNHKDVALEILKRKEIYPESRIEELYKEFGGRLFNSKDELVGLIHCNYIDKKEINKRPLSKLTKDILKQLA